MTITENVQGLFHQIEVSEMCGKVIAIATAAKIESIAKAISVNSTLITVDQKPLCFLGSLTFSSVVFFLLSKNSLI